MFLAYPEQSNFFYSMLKSNYLIKPHVLHHLQPLFVEIARKKILEIEMKKILFTSDVSQISQIPGNVTVSDRNGINETKRAKRC